MKVGETWRRKEKWRYNLSLIFSGEELERQMVDVVITKINKEIVSFKGRDTLDSWDRKTFLVEFEKVYGEQE